MAAGTTPTTLDETTAISLRAQRIRYVSPAPEQQVVARFCHPCDRVAVAAPVTAAEILAKVARPGDDQLEVVIVPSGIATSQGIQQQVEAWMHFASQSGSAPTVDLMMRSERVLWRPGQAAIFGAPERCEELLPGLIEFAFYEGELRRLERELDEHWQAAETDAALTHGVGRAQLKNQARVNEMTAAMARRRLRFARLEPCLEKASIALSGPARRLAGELALQSEVLDRLGWVDDRLEVYEDLYELANDRLTEFTYFSREFRLELWIILLLVLECVVMGLELWQLVRSNEG